MECPEGDVQVTVSFEILGHKSPADVTWVEQQQKKHERLPTNKLYLVSWSGFTQGAEAQAKSDPKIVLVTPELVLGADDKPVVRSLFEDEINLKATKVAFFINHPTKGELKVTEIQPDHKMFDVTGKEVGEAHELVSEFLNAPRSGQEVSTAYHSHPEREDVKWFTLGVKPIPDLNLFLRWDKTGELHPIIGLEVTGESSWKQTKVNLAVTKFGDVVFGHARTEILNRAAMIVAILGEKDSVKEVTTRVYADGKQP